MRGESACGRLIHWLDYLNQLDNFTFYDSFYLLFRREKFLYPHFNSPTTFQKMNQKK